MMLRARHQARRLTDYWNDGLWGDTRNKWWINLLKVLNISVRSFLDADLQTQACAMTYRTALALVPALALLFAIGRGFGLQSLIQQEVFTIVPARSESIDHAMQFANSYLNHSSEGVFVGVGIIFLLWTVISLLINVENTFNKVWGITQGRSIWRKISDYTAMLLILPVLLICGSGLTIFVSSTLQNTFHFSFMTPVISALLEAASWLFTFLFFSAMFALIPNTKVKLKNAFIAGVFTGIAFRILQWLFVGGQLYVTKYNAVYGSFAFVPLLLIWMQLTWMAVLCGALLCYSSQNIFMYAFSTQINEISHSYRRRVVVALTSLITRRFVDGQPALTELQLAQITEIPPRLLSDSLDELVRAGILVRVSIDSRHDIIGFQPAVDPGKLNMGMLRTRLENLGRSGFIPCFGHRFSGAVAECDKLDAAAVAAGDDVLLASLSLDLVEGRQAQTVPSSSENSLKS